MRLSYFKNASGSTEVLEKNDYYPFGLSHSANMLTLADASYQYQYSGKELQKETGWSDFGARMYMADIGRWGVIDPLAETTTRVNPYNYALNNPVMFIDPDGRKAMASTEMDENSVGFGNGRGMISYLGRGDSQSIMSFLGRSDEFMMSRVDGLGGGGGSNTGGMTFTDPYMIAFIQQGASQPGFINGLFSMVEQLKKAGFKNPEKTKALFSDADKMLQAGVFQDLNNILNYVAKQPINSKVYFKETTKWYIDGKSEGYGILLNVNNIKNVLELAYTIGHEIGHSITSYFSDTFYETVGSKGKIANNAFGYFGEYVSYSMEEQWGNSTILPNAKGYTYMKHGPEAALEAARVPQQSIDLVNNNLIKLMKAYSKFITIPNK